LPNILVTSASHLYSDHLLSSEGNHCYNLFKNLEKYGYHFDIITPLAKVLNPLDNVEIFQTGTIRITPDIDIKRKYELHFTFLMKGLHLAKELLKTRRYDIIHHILPAVYGNTFSPIAISSKKFSTPFLFGPISCHFISRPIDERMLRPITNRLHFDTILKCDKIIVINEIVKKLYNNVLGDEKISTIPFGVDENIFHPTQKEENDVFEILYVGSLTKIKGLPYLIKALPLVLEEEPNVTLKIVGEGNQKTSLNELVKKLDIVKHVMFLGFVQHHQTPRFFQHCDVFCYPTLGEPFGKSIIEAMACGKAVVTTNIGGPSEIVSNGVDGVLVPPRDEAAIASGILDLIKDDNKRRKLGETARRTVEEKYSWERISDQYHELYSSLV